jgi:uncharacterized membrane protein HdeD (DUF308 family)
VDRAAALSPDGVRKARRGLLAVGIGWAALNGALAVVCGLLIALSLPASGAWAIGLTVGVYLVWWALDALMMASLLKRLTGA